MDGSGGAILKAVEGRKGLGGVRGVDEGVAICRRASNIVGDGEDGEGGEL